MNIMHTKRLLCYWRSSFSGLGLQVSYDWWATCMATKLSPMHITNVLIQNICEYSWCGPNSQAMPGLLSTSALKDAVNLLATKCLTIVFCIYRLVQQRMLLRICSAQFANLGNFEIALTIWSTPGICTHKCSEWEHLCCALETVLWPYM